MQQPIIPHDNDVLSGRGNRANLHPGNIYFRSLITRQKTKYVASSAKEKKAISRQIVDQIHARNPPGRFLHQNNDTQEWELLTRKKILKKTGQGLREGAPELRASGGANGINEKTSDVAQTPAEENPSEPRLDDSFHFQDISTPSEAPGQIPAEESIIDMFDRSMDFSEIGRMEEISSGFTFNSSKFSWSDDQKAIDAMMASARTNEIQLMFESSLSSRDGQQIIMDNMSIQTFSESYTGLGEECKLNENVLGKGYGERELIDGMDCDPNLASLRRSLIASHYGDGSPFLSPSRTISKIESV
jgi:hypothetical protein